MLAGPRRKQKISVDPRNKNWIEDPNQFGRRLMERMGWSDGKGLGSKEDGEKDFVRVSVKGNTKGLGFNRNEEENWISHQDDFNDLLSQLHHEHSSQGEEVSDNPKSIEEKSKNSRKRVHYKKFTRGKDLANRSVDDMNCILGKRSGSSTPQNLSAPTSDNEGDNHGVKTVTNTTSVQDYFAQKMRKMKEARRVNDDQVKDSDMQADSPPDQEDGRKGVDSDVDEPKKRKKKKNKKKNKRKLDAADTGGSQEGDVGGSEDCEDVGMVGFIGFKNTTNNEDGSEEQQEVVGEDRMGVSRREVGAYQSEVGSNACDDDDVDDETPMKKKKKKRRKKNNKEVNIV
ncbi:PIN2/TERF1-interacting telomerase inhibitor 1-like [Apostichopus japonicus]|uniref:PIN2/TERF1-interacting telomerase inhibitor 1-like n=1 Tax=Stichopus japonicus TaxID=307972 RepID=UPI003AB8BEF3